MLLVYNKLGLKTAYLSNTLGFGEKNKNIKVMFDNSFYFYFQKLVFGNIMKKQISCIFEIKNMFGQLKLKIQFFEKKQKILKYVVTRI